MDSYAARFRHGGIAAAHQVTDGFSKCINDAGLKPLIVTGKPSYRKKNLSEHGYHLIAFEHGYIAFCSQVCESIRATINDLSAILRQALSRLPYIYSLYIPTRRTFFKSLLQLEIKIYRKCDEVQKNTTRIGPRPIDKLNGFHSPHSAYV